MCVGLRSSRIWNVLCLAGCYTVYSGRNLPLFWTNIDKFLPDHTTSDSFRITVVKYQSNVKVVHLGMGNETFRQAY